MLNEIITHFGRLYEKEKKYDGRLYLINTQL